MAFNNLVDITRLQYFLEKLKALIPSASSAAPGKVSSSSSQGSSSNYARQDHTHGIDLATGDSNGQVKIAGNNVSVKGLAALAYKTSLGKSDVGLGNVDNVKQYSASNPPPYPVTSVNGSTGAVTVSIPSAATANPKMDGTAAVGTSAKFAKEDHVHPRDTTKVSTSGNETISGNKTFSGTTSITPVSTYAAPVNTVIPANATAIIQSPIPKYLWHDLFAFNRVKEPLYYTTTDGTSWTEATLEKRLFSHQEAWGTVNIISSSISGSRWVWTTNNALHACSGAWLVIGVGYSSTISHYDILFEQSTDGTTWTSLAAATNLSHHSVPIWIRTNGAASEKYIRLTITRNSSSGTSTNMPIVSIRWLTARWGNQGLGSEYEYPYQWNGTPDIYPLKNDTSELGTSSYKWKNINATKLNGVDIGSSPKFTDTTYESKAAASGGTAVSLVTTGEKYTWNNKGTYSKPSGGIPDSDIASAATWNAKGNGTITGIKMNGASKGTSGVVDLGTVITAHQSLSGKQDTLVSGTNIKTINGSSLLGSGDLAVSGLPAVTSSDNDKVLKVVNGVWVAAENDGGSMPVNAAVIHVNAPLGSAITFFKDSTVMEAVTAAQTHPNADGKTEDYYYSVPTSDFGSWTVAASKSGENDATQSFSVLVAKQYDAILSYLAPYDFQAVEWIQTSTAVYFDTGIIPTTTNYTTKVSLQVAVADGGYIFNVEGGYGMSQVGGYEQLRYNYVSGNTTINVPGIRTVGTDFDIIYNNDSGVVMVNGVEVSANPNIRALDNRRYSILVAAARYGANVSYYGTWRYKRFTVLERDTKNVLIDMHPCYRKMDNMPGFWDSVSNTFMTQLGTGTITVGPDV